MRLKLGQQKCQKRWRFRNVTDEDADLLGRLMLAAYRGTVDYEGETLDETISEVGGTLSGKYGPLLAEASFLIEENGVALSASLVTWWEEMDSPLLAFSMTHPSAKRTGMATLLLKLTINALLEMRYEELSLVVTESNRPARSLYEKLGFRPFR
jgi:GNAT superfamily N-acetyltransferase